MSQLIISRTYEHRLKVYERPDRQGIWIADYYLPPQHREEQVRQRYKIPARNKEQAERWKGHKLVALDKHEFDQIDYEKMRVEKEEGKEELTLEDFMPRFWQLLQRQRRPLSPRTVTKYEQDYDNHIKPRLGNMRLRDIDILVIDDFTDELIAKGSDYARPESLEDGTEVRVLKNSTINKITGTLGRILTFAKTRRLIDERPRIEKLPVVLDDDFDILDKGEVIRFFAACRGSYGRLFKVMTFIGARPMEAVALRWEDYDKLKRTLRIDRQLCLYDGVEKYRPPKWGSKRTLPVGPRLAAVLAEQAAETRLMDGLIFLSEANKPICHELLQKHLTRTCRRADLRRIVVSPRKQDRFRRLLG